MRSYVIALWSFFMELYIWSLNEAIHYSLKKLLGLDEAIHCSFTELLEPQ